MRCPFSCSSMLSYSLKISSMVSERSYVLMTYSSVSLSVAIKEVSVPSPTLYTAILSFSKKDSSYVLFQNNWHGVTHSGD